MSRYRRNRRRPMSEINVVPYIDVMLVLLVIFMITAPLLAQGVRVDLPQAPAEPVESEDQEPLVVTVDAEGHYYLNLGDEPDRVVDQQILVHRVAAVVRNNPQTQVLVRGDQAVNYGAVVQVMALLQGAGVTGVGLLTEAPHEESL